MLKKSELDGSKSEQEMLLEQEQLNEIDLKIKELADRSHDTRFNDELFAICDEADRLDHEERLKFIRKAFPSLTEDAIRHIARGEMPPRKD